MEWWKVALAVVTRAVKYLQTGRRRMSEEPRKGVEGLLRRL